MWDLSPFTNIDWNYCNFIFLFIPTSNSAPLSQQWDMTQIRFPMVPLGTNNAASFPVSSAILASNVKYHLTIANYHLGVITLSIASLYFLIIYFFITKFVNSRIIFHYIISNFCCSHGLSHAIIRPVIENHNHQTTIVNICWSCN